MLAGVISIGNVTFGGMEDEEKVIITYDEDLDTAAELFGVDSDDLRGCLTCLENKTRGEVVQKNFSKVQAEGGFQKFCTIALKFVNFVNTVCFY